MKSSGVSVNTRHIIPIVVMGDIFKASARFIKKGATNFPVCAKS